MAFDDDVLAFIAEVARKRRWLTDWLFVLFEGGACDAID